MEEFALYLLKSVIWLSGFALVYILFLRNERYFALNRFFLISGICSAFLLPLLTIRYSVVLPASPAIMSVNTLVTGIENMNISNSPDNGSLLLIFYLSGIIFVAFMILRQSRSVIRSIKKAEIIASSPVRVIRTSDYTSSFSFFSFVFVNPSVSDVEIREIMNHEMVHIRQKHWIDLVLSGLLCMLQWFNPVAWIYVRFIRQNHEYLADEVALQRTSDPAVYRATLLNQIAGLPVVSLANSFNYSLNKKRFNMMKNIISSPYRKMKILLILPVFAIVLYAFAKPEYSYSKDKYEVANPPGTALQKEIKGIISQEDGIPLQGAAVTISGTTIGTVSDAKGNFKIGNLPDDFLIVVSFVGYKTKVIKPVFNAEMVVVMLRDTINIGRPVSNTVPPPPGAEKSSKVSTIPPPPPLPPAEASGNILEPSGPMNSITIRSEDGKTPLIVLDGVITNIEVNKIDPGTIESITVIKDEAARKKYGEKAKDGVIEIITRKVSLGGQVEQPAYIEVSKTPTGEDDPNTPYVVVEEMPEFPGGKDAMFPWISQNIKYPEVALQQNIEGKVIVRFVVSPEGKVGEVVALRSDNQILNEEAIRVVSNMPLWKPGSQNGKKVNVYFTAPVEFKL